MGDYKSNTGLLIHKIGRLGIAPPLSMAAETLDSAGTYRYFASLYAQNRWRKIFDDQRWLVSALYTPGRHLANGFRRTIPIRLFPLEEHQQELQATARELKGSAYQLRTVTRGVRFGFDAAAVAYCMASDCDKKTWAAIGSDSVAVGAEGYTFRLFKVGVDILKETENSKVANGLLRKFHGQMMGIGGLNIVAGVARAGIEVDYYLETGHARPSSLAVAVGDISYGTYQITKASHILEMASGRNTIAAANRVLAFGEVRFINGVGGVMLGAGILSAFLLLGTNAYTIYDNLEDNGEVSEAVRHKNIVSGKIGIGAGLVFLASFALIPTPLAPLSGALYIGGMLILFGQAIYDHYDEFNEHPSDEVSFPGYWFDENGGMYANEDLPPCKELVWTGEPLSYECITKDTYIMYVND